MTLDELRVTLVQTSTWWHDAEKNLAHFEARIRPFAGQTDVIVLTETFTSGFTQHPSAVAQTMDGPAIAWMRRQAGELGAAVAGSMAVRDGDRFYNRFLWAAPDGTLVHYDKRHLFALAGEHERYAAGSQRVVLGYGGWRICPQVCYDLRFPVWSRNRDDYDVLVYVANWPEPRAQAWRLLLRGRAIENQAYVVGVNRVGTDGNGVAYAGGSAAVDYLGSDLADLEARDEAVTVTLSRPALDEFRRKLPFQADADRFVLPEVSVVHRNGGMPAREATGLADA